jgi:hypothetical protein
MHNHGIGIIGLGHEKYAHMAYNQAVSIKAAGDNTPVCFFYSPSSIAGLHPHKLEIFDKLIEIPEHEYAFMGKKAYQKAKTVAYKYTPYERTLMIDADSVWLHAYHKPSELFDELKDIDLTFTLYQPYVAGQMAWQSEGCTIADLMPMYGIKELNDFISIQSSLIYFRKSERAEKWYNLASEIYSKPKFPFQTWANGIADELTFNIASAILQIKPHDVNWKPLAYPQGTNRIRSYNRNQHLSTFYVLSMAGNQMPADYKREYRATLVGACRKLGIKDTEIYFWQDKKAFDKSRKKW